uniref:Uncharacterized protein n=1 Tax=Caenorhabditis tropicalis TaxID=1561998 RepID=A0A1I7TV84_9PELO
MEEILRTGSERKRRAPEENSNDPNAPGSSNRFRPSTFFVPRVPPIVSPSGVPQAPGSSSPGLMPDVIAPETRPIPRQVDNLFMNEHLPHIDLVRYPNESPPEYDPNWVSPPGTPPIAAYADALAFHRSRNIRDNRDENDSNQNPDV